MHAPNSPLPDTHPELIVTHWQGFTEYRVEHWRLARDGSGRVVRGTSVFSRVDAGVLVLAAVFFFRTQGHAPRPIFLAILGLVLTLFLWARCTQVLHESLLVFPNLGIQLSTHRGHPLLPTHALVTKHHFIPLAALEDVIIHEGLHGWNVRYYLAALQRRRARGSVGEGEGEGGSRIEVHVAFENILPYFPVLKAVYLDVQQTLFPPPTRIVEEG